MNTVGYKEPRVFGSQAYWRGKNVELMTKAELIEALVEMAKLRENDNKEKMKIIERLLR